VQSLLAAVDPEKRPDFALMFSCLGRGPLFYGNDDRDLLAFREIFPGVPLLGAYGSGQIAPAGDGNRLFQNTVVTLLSKAPMFNPSRDQVRQFFCDAWKNTWNACRWSAPKSPPPTSPPAIPNITPCSPTAPARWKRNGRPKAGR
jgi:hypothetical protein